MDGAGTGIERSGVGTLRHQHASAYVIMLSHAQVSLRNDLGGIVGEQLRMTLWRESTVADLLAALVARLQAPATEAPAAARTIPSTAPAAAPPHCNGARDHAAARQSKWDTAGCCSCDKGIPSGRSERCACSGG